MLVREAQLNDICGLLKLYSQLLPNETFDPNISVRTLEEICRNNDYHIIIVIVNGMIVSTCTLVIIKNITHRCKPFGILENVVTETAERGHGYGKIALGKAIDIAIANQCHKIMVQTKRREKYVLDFYKSCGFSTDLSTGLMMNLEVNYE